MSASPPLLHDRYRLDALLGQGGFARVYLASDLRLRRQVAVKILDPAPINSQQSQDFLARFEREAHAVAALDHPNILGVHDYGQDGHNVYLVMPYIAGGTLDGRLRAAGGHLDPDEAVAYLHWLASALDYAHARGIVHRDLKPQNVLLHADGRPLLADFGIAKLLGEATTGQSRSQVVGTLPYMAPEQFRGQVGPASDIYALGCMTMQLLTGAPPYGGPTEQIMYGHVFGEIPRVSVVSDGRLPATLDPILARALAKQPEERYQRASALVADCARALRAARATTPQPTLTALPSQPPVLSTSAVPAAPTGTALPESDVAARPPISAHQTASAPKRRNRLPLFAGASAAILLLALVGGVVASRQLGAGTPTATREPTSSLPGAAATATAPPATTAPPTPTSAAVIAPTPSPPAAAVTTATSTAPPRPTPTGAPTVGPTAIPQPAGTIPPGWKVYRGPVEFPIVFAYPPDWTVEDGLFPNQYALFLYSPTGHAENEVVEIANRPRQNGANIDVLRDDFFHSRTQYCDKTGIERTSYRRISGAQFAILGATCNAGATLGFIQVASGLTGDDEWSVAMRVPYARSEAVVRDIFDPLLASMNIYAPIANR